MFSPILLAALGSILRRVLTLLAGYLVGAGFWAADESNTYVEAFTGVLTVALLTVAYALYDKYVSPHVVRILTKS